MSLEVHIVVAQRGWKRGQDETGDDENDLVPLCRTVSPVRLCCPRATIRIGQSAVRHLLAFGVLALNRHFARFEDPTASAPRLRLRRRH